VRQEQPPLVRVGYVYMPWWMHQGQCQPQEPSASRMRLGAWVTRSVGEVPGRWIHECPEWAKEVL
jgi:hypothetical protein